MKTSTDRIITTHVGSLGRPTELLDVMKEKAHGRPYDTVNLAELVARSVRDIVRRQVETGLDVVTDGEMGKVSFVTYVLERLSGYSSTDGETMVPPSWKVEIDAFPEYYGEYLGKYKNTVSPLRVMECIDAVSYVGAEAVQTDISNLQAALSGVDVVTDLRSSMRRPSVRRFERSTWPSSMQASFSKSTIRGLSRSCLKTECATKLSGVEWPTSILKP